MKTDLLNNASVKRQSRSNFPLAIDDYRHSFLCFGSMSHKRDERLSK